MSMSQDARCPECGTLHAGPGEYESYTTSPGQADVPFGCAELTHTYMLRTYGGHGPGASDTLVITAGVPQIDSFSVTPVGTCADPTALFETTGGYGPPARQPEPIREP